MGNVFDVIHKLINKSNTPTYGEILENNKEKQKENAIKRMLSSDEYEQYKTVAGFDQQRFMNENHRELSDNYLIGNDKKKEINVFGVGNVIQIC